ncbi:AI-2E family transporter [Thalassobacillus sp. CUG 92003]|uniref:AI-2E family transporter n=1 Tax=Thalassobacillus sp. CUG 92003 TaxID=2736641 RepID=UPI0015E63760|nr:AI-2E family transporter [Thalassobacillus sp. CUG 92003]
MWLKHPFFKYITGTILILITILLLEVLHFFEPVKVIIGTIFFPLLIAGFFYYIIKPFVRFLSRFRYISVTGAILLVYAGIAGVLYAGSSFLVETVKKQITKLSSNLPKDLKQTADETKKTLENNNPSPVSVENFRQKATQFMSDAAQTVGENVTEIVSTVTGAATVLVVVPFILFYLLKDDARFTPFLLKFIPTDHEKEGEKLLRNIDRTLAAYIIGQLTVALVDGVLMYAGYLIIGLDYALILAFFVVITAVVPFFGPLLGVLPALVVALTQEPTMALYVLITLVVVQQIEGNVVAPVVLGSRLNVHPLTIILLLMVAAALYGFIGMIIAIPLYSVIKVIVKNLYHFYRLRHS